MRLIARLLAATAVAGSAPTFAGETVRYEPAASWVVPADLPTEPGGAPLVLLDNQQRLEDGRLTAYIDQAVRIDNPQILQAAGTIQALWQPDKGDLTIHRVEIVRAGQTIDLLRQGSTFDVLRREQDLEQRMIDGALTATMAVPGLRVGDILRTAYTVTTSDQALDQEVQTSAPLPARPFETKFGRVRFSWPEGSDVRLQATGLATPVPQVRDGFATVEVSLPLPERDEVPEDAPVRFQMPALLQAGTFADWPEVSRVMAPLYATEGKFGAASPVAAETARIAATHSAPLARAVAALRLVQDEVAYLANGMAGGNYIPQAPELTWQNRFGDCKAKTLLLLGMLRDLGIEAEAVLVSTAGGDAVPQLLPMPGAFDHVIVRATIDGQPFWLDGTQSGASLANVHQAPPFANALPMRREGSGLMPIEMRPKQGFDYLSRVTVDHRAGLDVPMLYTAEFTLAGPAAGAFRAMADQASQEQREEVLGAFAQETMGDTQLLDSAVAFDPAENVATVRLSGLMTTPWRFERGRGVRTIDVPTDNFEFRPDRSRRTWQDIPVALPGPFSQRTELTLLLPEGEESYRLEGRTTFEEQVAGTRLGRQASLEGNRLTITDWTVWAGGELPAAQVAAERAKATRMGPLQLSLRAPENAERRFELAGAGDRTRLAPLEAAYARLISKDPDVSDNYRNRARFRLGTFDRAGALADFTRVIEAEPTAADLFARSRLLMENGDYEAALADAQQAAELEPSVSAALFEADVLSYLGRVDEAVSVLDRQNPSADERRDIAIALSDLDALAGRKAEGLSRIEELMAERPGDPNLLNAKCWYQATWNHNPDELPQLCTEAVERADFSPQALDSRALGYFRLARYQDALEDLEAALSGSPDQVPSLFMRGIVRRELGDRGGDRDVRAALARQPSLARYFARFGIAAE